MNMFRFISVFILLCALRALGQVSIDISLEQDQFLPSEAIPVTIRITNRSGQPIHLGAQPDWLTFNVESADSFIVSKNGEVPVSGEFVLGSSETATRKVNIEPYFGLGHPGLYRVTATLRIKDWNSEVVAGAKRFDISSGAKIWSQAFGIPSSGTNQPPEVRKYVLEKSNYLRSQLRLYVLITDDSETHAYNIAPIGQVVSFSRPETQIDRFSNLHLLYQSGGQTFLYSIVNPNGDIVRQEVYDYSGSRPRLGLGDDGEITVVGGVKRTTPTDVPNIKSPDELIAPKK